MTVLRYVDHVDLGGGSLTDAQLDAFASTRPPWSPVAATSGNGLVPARSMAFVPPAGSVSEYLRRVEWVVATERGVQLTELGSAVVRGALEFVESDPPDVSAPDLASPRHGADTDPGRRFAQ